MSEVLRDVKMADESQSQPGRSTNATTAAPLLVSNSARSLVLMLDDVQAPKPKWVFHRPTGVVFHAEDNRCEVCFAYIKHLQDAKRRE